MEKIFDSIIVGSGPAAYTAALFLKNKKICLFEGGDDLEIGPGGQLMTTTNVDNYPGFPIGITGPKLMDRIKNQATMNNIPIIGETIISVVPWNTMLFKLKTQNREILSKTVIIATGASAKKLEVSGSKQYWNRGISACAVCDGFFYINKICAVIGGGDTALEESIYLSNICKQVILIHRRTEFRARMDKIEKAKHIQNIKFMTPFILQECKGNGNSLTSIIINNVNTNENIELNVDGLFFAIGHTPNTQLLQNETLTTMELIRPNGYIKCNSRCECTIPGLFACGDVQDYEYRQAVTAAASGYTASQTCLEYLETFNKN